MAIDEGLKLAIEPLRSLIFSSISGTYFKIVNVATTHPARLVCFTNTTNSNLFISLNGVDDHLVLPANGFKLLDIMTNHYPGPNSPMQIPQQTFFWARTATGSSNPTSGFVYAEVYYGD